MGNGGENGRHQRRWYKVRTGKARLFSTLPRRRVVTAVIALSLWVGAGGIVASAPPPLPSAESFGAMHWYMG